jgi:hypothetical protein
LLAAGVAVREQEEAEQKEEKFLAEVKQEKIVPSIRFLNR